MMTCNPIPNKHLSKFANVDSKFVALISKAVNQEDMKRESRKCLSKTNQVPEWLLQKYAPPEWALIHHTVHKDNTLPLFQAKIQGGDIFEGKILTCRHYGLFVCNAQRPN